MNMDVSALLSTHTAATATTAATAFARLIPYEIASIFISIVNIYVFVIIVWVILSWFRARKGFARDLYQALDKIVAPFMNLFKRFIPTAGGLDFSPIIAILILQVIARVIASL